MHLTYIVLQISKPPAQTASLASDKVDVTLIHFLELLKLMRLMQVAKEATVGADGNLARLTEVAQRSIVQGAQLLFLLLALLILRLHHRHDIREEAARD